MGITVFAAKNCLPCREVKDLIEKGRVSEKVDLVDIETDEGFERFSKEVLSSGDGAVPSAYKDGMKCTIKIDEEKRIVIFDCPQAAPPAGQPS